VNRPVPPVVAVAVLSLAAATAASPRPAVQRFIEGDEFVCGDVRARIPSGSATAHSFYFTRAVYTGSRRRGWGSWATDYPKADCQFLVVLRRVTNLDAYPREHPILLDDPDLRRYPFLYAVEVGRMDLTDAEVDGLRDYLRAGGFLVVDDFWGSRQWEQFEENIRRVFPDRPIVEVPKNHEVFRSYYRIDEIVQVPARGRSRWQTWEGDGRVPHLRGIFDDDGRLVVAINWNTDLGDAWEWADVPDYPLEYSTFAYKMGINLIVYAMSH
jgi:hypothetical protein